MNLRRLEEATHSTPSMLAILIIALVLAGCGGQDVSASAAESQAVGQAISNSAVADQYRVSLIKYVEGDQVLRDLLKTYNKKNVLSPERLPGYREGWKAFEAQFAIENLDSSIRQAPDMCAVVADSGGYTRVFPDAKGCKAWCGPTYGVTGPMLAPVPGLVAAGGVRYNVLRMFGEVPDAMQPVTMTLFTPLDGSNCSSLEMGHVWGEYDFAQPPVVVTFPFDALPSEIPDISNGAATIDFGSVSATIGNVRLEPTESNQGSYYLTADVTYTNNGGNDVNTSGYRIYGLSVHESGQHLGQYEASTGIVPPGIPKTFSLRMGLVEKEDYAGTWFYVLFVDGGGNSLAQAQVAMPR